MASDNSIYLLGFFKIRKVNTVEGSLELIAENVPGGFDSHRKRSIDMLPNGNIVYTGGRSDTGPILHSYSPDGVHQWSRSYNSFGAIYFGTGSKNLLVMPDGSILFPMHHGGMVLIKTDSEGNVVANDDELAPVITNSIRIYPNPIPRNEPLTTLKLTGSGISRYERITVEMFNLKGQKIKTWDIAADNPGSGDYQINCEGIATGVYFICAKHGTERLGSTKLLIY